MPNRVLRVLVLAASLPLALPAGWCCMVQSGPARTGTGSLCPGPAMPCGCGRSEPQPEPPSPDGPTPQPRPFDPGKCCCSDRNTLEPKPTDFTPPTLFVAVLPFVTDVVAPHAVAGLPHWSVHVPSPPIHVLQCVWLC